MTSVIPDIPNRPHPGDAPRLDDTRCAPLSCIIDLMCFNDGSKQCVASELELSLYLTVQNKLKSRKNKRNLPWCVKRAFHPRDAPHAHFVILSARKCTSHAHCGAHRLTNQLKETGSSSSASVSHQIKVLRLRSRPVAPMDVPTSHHTRTNKRQSDGTTSHTSMSACVKPGLGLLVYKETYSKASQC